ncbi:energy transducer TonB [Sphingobacterium yanglingense]|uniref:TonB-like protein n=1 Tax=Sphingobacterium yanglingense TaxID=1437280 RepID=A0A4R6WED1_9SPHI|nr:energy transducer TonB [Sphingobacterium yanglingense]TDQ76532.1 TonB-like protein [Sphingobacterium yanglingense]
MVYLLLVNIALTIGFCLYHICFRKLTFFQWNRLYLLGIVVLAILIPIGLFIDISSLIAEDEVIPHVNFIEVMDVIYIPIVVDTSYSLVDLLTVLYWTVVSLGIIALVYRLWMVNRAFASEESHVSFSFFKRVFLGAEVRNDQVIDRHEQVHVEQGHSYDVLLLELICVFNWFNPIVYLIRKELKFQHECIADEFCSEDKVAYAELLVANAMRTDLNSLVHEFSNQSFLKKRIMMLFKNKSSNRNKLFYLASLPVLLVAIGSTLVFNTSRAKEVVASVETQLADVSFPKSAISADRMESEVGTSNLLLLTDQDTSKKINTQDPVGDEVIFETTEINPEPPGGMVAYRKWIGENYQYPKAAIDADIKGTLQIYFVVEKDGQLSNLKVVRDLGYGTGEAALDMLSKSAKWSPAVQNGKAVRIAYTLPIRLDLTTMFQKRTNYRAKPELGESRLQEWLVSSYKSPRTLTSKDLDPWMWATFDVAPDGSLSNFAVGSVLEESFKSRFVALLKNTKWIPAEENGAKQKSRAAVGLRLAGGGAVLSKGERVEVLPEPKGGMRQFMVSVASKISFPPVLRSLKQEGTLVELGFDVLPNGELGNFKVITEAHAGMAKDVIAAAKSYGNWSPGIIDGKKTVTSYTLPVQYDLEGDGQVRIAGLMGGNMRVYPGN